MRVPRDADAAHVLALINEHAPEPETESLLEREWSSPRVVLERDARIEADAYVLVESLDADRVWVNLHGRPSSELLDWADTRSAELALRVFSGAWSTNVPVLTALQDRGFGRVRSSHRMLLELTEATADPHWPAGIAVRTFESGDERLFYDVHQETFKDVWEPIEETYDVWAHWFLAPPTFDPELWFLAHAHGEPAGIAICHPHEARPDHGWIHILGVRREWRGRGVGRALLLNAFAEFRRRGLVKAGLGVDSESPTGALGLYESAGMQVAARFDIYEKAVA